jgi:hypothetical protein
VADVTALGTPVGPEVQDVHLPAGWPVLSIDTKAKERLGLYCRGRVWCDQAFRAFDHDLLSWAEGVVIPHGIYDERRNRGHVNIGLSRPASAG